MKPNCAFTRRQLCKALAASLWPAAWPALAAGGEWPSRPIKWVLPYLPGTGPDITARTLAEAVSPLLGQPVVIENRAGAAGNIGARLAAIAPADGYTWVFSAAPMAANMRMYANPGYDALKDFRHIMRLTTSDILLVVHPASGIGTVHELVERARLAPGKLDYASGGVGSPSHLGVELFLSTAGMEATHVPYKGASEMVSAVLGRQVAFAMPIFSVAYPHVQAGRLKALAVAGTRRNTALPEVPTLAEAGVPGVSLTSWGGISVPVRTPDAVVARIHAAFEQAVRQPAVRAAIEATGGSIDPADSQEYARSFVQEIALTEAMMKRARLTPM